MLGTITESLDNQGNYVITDVVYSTPLDSNSNVGVIDSYKVHPTSFTSSSSIVPLILVSVLGFYLLNRR